jgi:hypothetical protein
MLKRSKDMLNETDLSQEKNWLYEQRSKMVVNNLIRKNINAQFVSTKQEALAVVMAMIPVDAKVARGDSITVEEVGIHEALEKRGQKTIYPQERNLDGSPLYPTSEQRHDKAREAFSADVFLVSTNAITLDGKLVNIDGWGNRTSAMIFGPKKVIVVAGANKIVKDVAEGLERIHSIAAPMNNKRFFLKYQSKEAGDLPCARTGICVDCNHEMRSCRYTVIIDGTRVREKGRINVVLVGEALGI